LPSILSPCLPRELSFSGVAKRCGSVRSANMSLHSTPR
jgi:hypothetical protein